jgi:AraC family L-rhamnose operon regulatory protein RhaS
MGGKFYTPDENEIMSWIISYGHFPIKELAPHKNQGMEITFVEKGVMEWMVEGRPEKVEPGSVFFTLPWQVHGSLQAKEPENTVWHILFHLKKAYQTPRTNFKFTKALGFSAEESKILSETFASSTRHCFQATPTIRSLIPALIGELQSTRELRNVLAITLLRAILVELKRVVGSEVTDTATYTPSEQRVQEFITRLSSDCGQQWTLANMAHDCGIRRTQLCKIFHKLTGSTPMEFLSRIRIEHAKTLLRRSDTKVIDIAFECGYSSSQYFAKTFRQATGQTPSVYRDGRGKLSSAESRDWEDMKFRSEDEEIRRIEAFSDPEK